MRTDRDSRWVWLSVVTAFFFLVFLAVEGKSEVSCTPKACDTKKVPKCEEVLKLCDEAVERLKDQVKASQDEADRWKKEAYRGTNPAPGLLTFVGVGAASGAVSGLATDSRNGLALGVVSGAVVGLALGLLFQ